MTSIKCLLASTYQKHTKLKKTDIDKLTNKHIETFEGELKKVYGAYAFSAYADEVRLALFDMIFTLDMINFLESLKVMPRLVGITLFSHLQ